MPISLKTQTEVWTESSPTPYILLLLLHFTITKADFLPSSSSQDVTPQSGLFVPPAENRVTPAAEGVGADAFWA